METLFGDFDKVKRDFETKFRELKSSIENEEREFEARKKKLEEEKKIFEQEKRIFEQEKKIFEQKRRIFELERDAFERGNGVSTIQPLEHVEKKEEEPKQPIQPLKEDHNIFEQFIQPKEEDNTMYGSEENQKKYEICKTLCNDAINSPIEGYEKNINEYTNALVNDFDELDGNVARLNNFMLDNKYKNVQLINTVFPFKIMLSVISKHFLLKTSKEMPYMCGYYFSRLCKLVNGFETNLLDLFKGVSPLLCGLYCKNKEVLGYEKDETEEQFCERIENISKVVVSFYIMNENHIDDAFSYLTNLIQLQLDNPDMKFGDKIDINMRLVIVGFNIAGDEMKKNEDRMGEFTEMLKKYKTIKDKLWEGNDDMEQEARKLRIFIREIEGNLPVDEDGVVVMNQIIEHLNKANNTANEEPQHAAQVIEKKEESQNNFKFGSFTKSTVAEKSESSPFKLNTNSNTSYNFNTSTWGNQQPAPQQQPQQANQQNTNSVFGPQPQQQNASNIFGSQQQQQPQQGGYASMGLGFGQSDGQQKSMFGMDFTQMNNQFHQNIGQDAFNNASPFNQGQNQRPTGFMTDFKPQQVGQGFGNMGNLNGNVNDMFDGGKW